MSPFPPCSDVPFSALSPFPPDTFRLGKSRRRFKELKVEVSGGRVEMLALTVVYDNGQRPRVDVRHTFDKGSLSRSIDLSGDRGRSTACGWSTPPGPAGRW